MALVRWTNRDLEPADTFDWLQEQINDLFEGFPQWPTTRGLFDRAISPAVNVVESNEGYIIECELPGVDQKNVDVTVSEGVLTIKGEKKSSEEHRDSKVYRKEMWEGSFQRTLSLPQHVDSERIDATYTDGILRISLPKKESAMPKRIELKAK